MNALAAEPKIALKNIVFATDFGAQANRALPFAVALAEHFGAKLFITHVIPEAAYCFSRPDSVNRIWAESHDYARYRLGQIVGSLQSHDRTCEALVGEGDPGEVIAAFAQTHGAVLIVIGTSSRAGVGKLLLGSVAEDTIRVASCPVLTVGPHVKTGSLTRIQNIVCAVDFSLESLSAAELAVSLACEYQAQITLTHVLDEVLQDYAAMQAIEVHLLDLVPFEAELPHKPDVIVEIGPVAECILNLSERLSADLVVMGVRGTGAFGQMASHFGSIAHKVISLATCPGLTVGGRHERGQS